jgi:aspartate/glutamate racemase
MQQRMMGCIYAVKEGKLDLAKDLALEVAGDFLAMGARNLLLACTELPIALGEAEMARLPCLDVTSAFADACVRHALALERQNQGVA